MQNSKLSKWLAALFAGLVLTGLITWARGVFSATTVKERLLCICDGFSVSGILFLCVSIMGLIAGEGIFDVLGYAVQKGLHHILPGRFGEDAGSFYDYKSAKLEKTTKKSQKVMLITGVGLLGVGLLLMVIWYRLA